LQQTASSIWSAAGDSDPVYAAHALCSRPVERGVAAADLVMLDVAMELYDGADAQRGFAGTAEGL